MEMMIIENTKEITFFNLCVFMRYIPLTKVSDLPNNCNAIL